MLKLRILLVLFLSAMGVDLLAQSGSGSPITLPVQPTSWLNSGPISGDALKGKGAVFYFFEEG
ncbi:MAG: hypothetical protein AAF483_15130 [Planctomycetota bacterium]